MEETPIDRAAMGRLAKALVFICGPDHPTTVALQAAAESASELQLGDDVVEIHRGPRQAVELAHQQCVTFADVAEAALQSQG